MSKCDWEKIYTTGIQRGSGIAIAESTYRMRVFGGWIVLQSSTTAVSGLVAADVKGNTSMCFVPDPKHEWQADHVS